MLKRMWLSVTFLSLCNATPLQVDPESVQRFELPEPDDSQLSQKKSIWGTEYHIHQARNYDYGYPLLDMVGKPLGAALNHNDWCESALEGTVAVKYSNGGFRVFNYDGVATNTQVNCYAKYPRLPERVRLKLGKTRYRIAHGAYGDGYDGHILSPFRTLAVDPKVFPLRTVMYVPSAKGIPVTLPNGEIRIHDGYFFSADIGGAIRDNHIDFFIGFASQNPFKFLQGPNKPFDVYVINDENIMQALLQSHLPAAKTE